MQSSAHEVHCRQSPNKVQVYQTIVFLTEVDEHTEYVLYVFPLWWVSYIFLSQTQQHNCFDLVRMKRKGYAHTTTKRTTSHA